MKAGMHVALRATEQKNRRKCQSFSFLGALVYRKERLFHSRQKSTRPLKGESINAQMTSLMWFWPAGTCVMC